MYKIDKNMDEPKNKSKSIKDTLSAMEINDSFLLPYLDRPNYFVAKSTIKNRLDGKKFSSKRIDKDHVIIRRIN